MPLEALKIRQGGHQEEKEGDVGKEEMSGVEEQISPVMVDSLAKGG